MSKRWTANKKTKPWRWIGSLTCKLQAGSAAEDGAPRVEGRALVRPRVLVLVQLANDEAAPRHVTPVVAPQINERPVPRPSGKMQTQSVAVDARPPNPPDPPPEMTLTVFITHIDLIGAEETKPK